MKRFLSDLHDELDGLHELLQFGDLVDLPVGFMDVEPALAHITQTCPDAGTQRGDPTVLQEQRHLDHSHEKVNVLSSLSLSLSLSLSHAHTHTHTNYTHTRTCTHTHTHTHTMHARTHACMHAHYAHTHMHTNFTHTHIPNLPNPLSQLTKKQTHTKTKKHTKREREKDSPEKSLSLSLFLSDF